VRHNEHKNKHNALKIAIMLIEFLRPAGGIRPLHVGKKTARFLFQERNLFCGMNFISYGRILSVSVLYHLLAFFCEILCLRVHFVILFIFCIIPNLSGHVK
jgi:hypothetical protein